MQNEINKATSRRFVQQIFNDGELSRIRDFVASDAWNHELGEKLTRPGRSPERYADFISLYRDAFPDLRVEIQDQVAENDRVVTSLRLKGTQKNPLLGVPSRGKSMEVDGIRIDRFVGDKIAESWFQWDSVGMLRQLGALPNLRKSETAPTAAKPAPAPANSNLPVPEATPALARTLTFSSGSTSVTATPAADGLGAATLTLRELKKAS